MELIAVAPAPLSTFELDAPLTIRVFLPAEAKVRLPPKSQEKELEKILI